MKVCVHEGNHGGPGWQLALSKSTITWLNLGVEQEETAE